MRFDLESGWTMNVEHVTGILFACAWDTCEAALKFLFCPRHSQLAQFTTGVESTSCE